MFSPSLSALCLVLSHTLGCCLPLPTSSFLPLGPLGLLVSAPSEPHGLTWAGLPGSGETQWQPRFSSLLIRANWEAGLFAMKPGLRDLAACDPLPPVSCFGNTDSSNPPCWGRG